MNLIWGGGNEAEIKLTMSREFMKMKNGCSDTPLHYAAYKGRTSLISDFINLGSDLDAQDDWKNTPLHWAAANGHVDVIEILVNHGARINILGQNDETAQQKAKKYGKTAAAEYLLKIENELPNQRKLFQSAIDDDLNQFQQLFIDKYHLFIVDTKTNVTLYETLENNRANKIINYMRTKPITKEDLKQFRKLFKENNAGFIKALESNPLAKFFFSREILDFEEHVCVENVNKMTSLNFKFPSQLAKVYGSRLVMDDIQKYLINVENKDEEIKEEEIEDKIKKELEMRKYYLERKLNKNYSRLHIAIFDNCPNAVENILKKNICNVNDGYETVAPPIYYCIKLRNRHCFDILSKYNPNMDYIDKNNQSLLHMIVKNNMIEMWPLVTDHFKNYGHRDQMGLTVLHVAVVKGDENMITIIIEKDDEWNRNLAIDHYNRQSQMFDEDNSIKDNFNLLQSVKSKLSSKENVISLNIKIHNTIFDCFIAKMNETDVLMKDGDDNNSLHLAATRMLTNTCRKLINITTKCLFERNAKGHTALMEVIDLAITTMKGKVTDNLMETVECLISDNDQIHLSSEFNDGKTVIQKSLEVEDERLILCLTKSKPFIRNFTKEEIWFCLEKKFYNFLEHHLEQIIKSETEKAITTEVFMNCIDVVPYNCMERIYIYSDDNNKSSIVENMMYIIYKYKGDLDLFHQISKIEISIPQLLKNGESILTYIINQGDADIFEELLMMRHINKLANTKNLIGQLPIHLAITSKNYDFVSSLIPLTSNIEEVNIDGETALYLLIKEIEENKEEKDKSSFFRLVKMIVYGGGNIYLRNDISKLTPIDQCKNKKWKYKIEKSVHEIRQSQQQQQGAATPIVTEENKCPVCTVNAVDCIFQCGHKYCLTCGFRVNICPNCREGPTNATRISHD